MEHRGTWSILANRCVSLSREGCIAWLAFLLVGCMLMLLVPSKDDRLRLSRQDDLSFPSGEETEHRSTDHEAWQLKDMELTPVPGLLMNIYQYPF